MIGGDNLVYAPLLFDILQSSERSCRNLWYSTASEKMLCHFIKVDLSHSSFNFSRIKVMQAYITHTQLWLKNDDSPVKFLGSC